MEAIKLKLLSFHITFLSWNPNMFCMYTYIENSTRAISIAHNLSLNILIKKERESAQFNKKKVITQFFIYKSVFVKLSVLMIKKFSHKF